MACEEKNEGTAGKRVETHETFWLAIERRKHVELLRALKRSRYQFQDKPEFHRGRSRRREAQALSQLLGRANLYWKLSLLWSIQLQIRQGWSQNRQFLHHVLRDPLESGRATWQYDMNVQNLTGCQRRTPLPMKFGKNHLSTKRKRSAPTEMMFLSGNSKFFFFLLTTRLCRTNSCGCQRGHFGTPTLWRSTSNSSENGVTVIKSPSRAQETIGT